MRKARSNSQLRRSRKREPNRRPLNRSNRVSTLRELLDQSRHPADSDLFTTSEVAGAVEGSKEVIRQAAFRGMIHYEHLPSEKARKLFFKGTAVWEFVDRYRIAPFTEFNSRVFRSQKIALTLVSPEGKPSRWNTQRFCSAGFQGEVCNFICSAGFLKKIGKS
jgi:hypothetical protein